MFWKLSKDALFLAHNIPPSETGDTILFLDEIQESPVAIGLLRYFYEEIPDVYVIAAGSLLEFAIKQARSFPAGRVEYLNMPYYLGTRLLQYVRFLVEEH